jgi:hypothetical protein
MVELMSDPIGTTPDLIKIAEAKARLRDGIDKRIDAAGSLLCAMQDRVKAGNVTEEELGALATVIELASGMQQIVLVYLQSSRVQVPSPDETRIVTG